MDFWTIILTCTACFVAIYFFYRKTMYYFRKHGIPHIPPVPILGNMWQISLRMKHMADIVRDVYILDEDAKYVGVYDFMSPIYVIRDPDLIKDIMVKNFDNFPNRPAFVDENHDPIFGKNLASLQGERWREVRNLLSPAFTSSKMKMMFGLISKCAQNFSDHVLKAASSDDNILEMKDSFTRYTNDVIATCAFGVEVDSMKNPTNEFYLLGKKATSFEGVLMKFFMIRAFPTLAGRLGIKLMSKQVYDFYTNLVSNIIKTRDEQGITRPDMIQLMMDARGKTSSKLTLDIVDMTAQAFIFFFGGFDSSSTFMTFVIHDLAVHPEIQERLQHEVDDILQSTNGNPTYEAVNNMPYLDAVINESMRCHPQAPALDRVCAKPYELPPALPGLKPITIRPGRNIWVPVAAIHLDSKYYENPHIYDPERFLSKKVTPSQTTFLGFGLGPRMCIANRFALLETKVLFFHLLEKCSFKPCAKTNIPLELNRSALNVSIKGGVWLEVMPRNIDTKST